MKTWMEGVAREIPTEIPGEICDAVEGAWQATAEGFERVQLGESALDEVESRFRKLDLGSDDTDLIILDVWKMARGGSEFFLCLLVRSYKEGDAIQGRGLRFECRMAGLFTLSTDIGQVMMRPESLGDKLVEFFKKTEVDFDQSPEFSESYYVLATDEARLREAVNPQLLDHLATRKDLYIEASDQDFCVLWSTVLSPESLVEACQFFSGISGRIRSSERSPYR